MLVCWANVLAVKYNAMLICTISNCLNCDKEPPLLLSTYQKWARSLIHCVLRHGWLYEWMTDFGDKRNTDLIAARARFCSEAQAQKNIEWEKKIEEKINWRLTLPKCSTHDRFPKCDSASRPHFPSSVPWLIQIKHIYMPLPVAFVICRLPSGGWALLRMLLCVWSERSRFWDRNKTLSLSHSSWCGKNRFLHHTFAFKRLRSNRVSRHKIISTFENALFCSATRFSFVAGEVECFDGSHNNNIEYPQ